MEDAEELAKLLRYLKAQHAVVVGSSSGGALAIVRCLKNLAEAVAGKQFRK